MTLPIFFIIQTSKGLASIKYCLFPHGHALRCYLSTCILPETFYCLLKIFFILKAAHLFVSCFNRCPLVITVLYLHVYLPKARPVRGLGHIRGRTRITKIRLFCSVQKFRKTYIQPMSVKNQAHSMFYAIFSRVYITVLTMEVETDCPDRQVFTRSGRSL